MSDIKISVIVPCYNVEKLLPRCLDSLVNQTLKEIEIICVNDASPDNGIRILREYESRYNNVHVIDLKENLRQGGARNRGMEVAQGEYIAFVDSDDYVERDMYEKLYARAAETGADVVTCDFYTVNENYELLCRHIHSRAHLCGRMDEDRREQLLLSIGLMTNMIHKKDLLNQHKIRFPEHIFFEDLYFIMVEALYIRHLEYLPECLYYYYENSNSTVREAKSSLQKISDRFESCDRVLNYYQEHGLTSRYPNALNFMIAMTILQNTGIYMGLPEGKHLSFLRGIRHRLKIKTVKTKEKNPFLRAYLTRKERVHLSLLKFSPWLYLNLWRFKSLLKNPARPTPADPT